MCIHEIEACDHDHEGIPEKANVIFMRHIMSAFSIIAVPLIRKGKIRNINRC